MIKKACKDTTLAWAVEGAETSLGDPKLGQVRYFKALDKVTSRLNGGAPNLEVIILQVGWIQFLCS